MKKEVFIDRISIFNFFALLSLRKTHDFFLLDSERFSNVILLKVLSFLKIHYEEKKFVLGELKSTSGLNLYTSSFKISSELAFDIANKMTQKDFIKNLNNKLGNKTIELFLAKKIVHYLTYYTNRILASKNLSKKSNPVIFLSRPEIFDGDELHNKFKNESLRFYFNPFSNPGPFIEKRFSVNYFFIFSFIRFFFRKIFIFFNYFLFYRRDLSLLKKEISVMSPFENEPGYSEGYKSQSFWKKNHRSEKYLLFSESLKDYDFKKKYDECEIINDVDNFYIKKNIPKTKQNIEINKVKRVILHKLFFGKNNLSRHLLFEIYKLFDRANQLIYVVEFFGIKNFFFYRTDFLITDAIQLISNKINVTTFCFQYSDMNFPTPLMMTSSDYLFLFSDFYENIFSKERIKPKNFISNGYPHDFSMRENLLEIREIREDLEANGVKFVISFFNESEQLGKWAHHDRSFNTKTIEFFAELILKNKNIGLILKPQKSIHSLDRYKNSEVIKNALKTGRIKELNKSSLSKNTYNLNLCYPSMAALASDLSVGIAHGGTAAIESALTKTKTVLLNLSNDHFVWSEVMKNENIVFTSLDHLEIEIKSLLETNKSSNLGDWSNVIHNFDKFRDSNGYERIYSFLKAN